MTDKYDNQYWVDMMTTRMKEVESAANSQSMCMAKWLQSTVYLGTGMTHSCHHPAVHRIPLSEIKKSPKALHNTEFKVQKRMEMLAGERPKECQYCWNIEDLPGNHMSDRTYKSSMSWSYPNLQKVIESKGGQDINPTYLEVAFDNTCNLKCMYCTPDVSSKWMEESERYGPYTGTSHNVGDIVWLKKEDRMPIPQKDDNPYVDAFWAWWPELYKELHTFRITGGEPLMSKNTWRILEEIKNNPRPDFTLAINTNMQVPKALLDRFIDYYNAIAPNIKEFQVHTSAEAHGKQADYIRTGMEYGSFMDNCRTFLRETGDKSRLNFMITFNILSLSTFDKFLSDIVQMRDDFNLDKDRNRVPFMINYLRWPQFQDCRVAPKEIRDHYAKIISDYMNTHTLETGTKSIFYLEELDQVKRLISYMDEPLTPEYLETQYKDFGHFYSQFDQRREVDFFETFPELNDFAWSCYKKAGLVDED